MDFICPVCDHPLEVGRDIPNTETSQVLDTINGVDCPNCGFVPLSNGSTDSDAAKLLEEPAERTISYATQLGNIEEQEIGHFKLVRILGAGSFGNVWLAEDINLGRQVALKLPISRSRSVDELLHEAQAAAHLRHPNIVSVYEVGTYEGQVFIACEYIEGMTLRDLLTTGKLTIPRTVELITSICGALDHAHSTGIVHRDVKPANTLINRQGQPFVTDFGLAKRISQHSTESTISSEGQVLGTARYMSPEQASGKTKETDRRSDIYAVGVMLFEMLTGHAPFRGNMRAVLQQKMFEDCPSPRGLDPTLPKDLETICLKCLERDPDKRYETAGAVAAELRRFHNGEPILARPISTIERTWRWCRRRPGIAVLLASLFASLTIGLCGVSFYWIRAANSAGQLRESLYRAQMTLASEYLAHGDVSGVQNTLDQIEGHDVSRNLRGFEWYYFQNLADPYKQIVNHGDHVSDLALSADGSRVASCGRDRSVHIWNTANGKRLRTLTMESGRFLCIAFSPLTNQLATGSTDGFVRFWNPMKPGEPIQQMKHGPPVSFVRFSSNGRQVVTAGSKGAIRIWDVSGERLLSEIPTGQAGTKDVRFSADSTKILVGTADGRVRIRDAKSNAVLQLLEPNPELEAVAMTDDEETVVTSAYDGTLRIWSVSDGTLEYSEPTSVGLIGDMEFLHDSQVLALVSTSGHLTLFDVRQRRMLKQLTSHYLTSGVLARSTDGHMLALGSGEGSVKLLDAVGLAQADVGWHHAHIRGLEFIDDKRLLAASGDGALRIWTVEDATGHTLIEPGGPTLIQMVAHAGRDIAAIATAEPAVRLYKTTTGAPARTLSLAESPVSFMRFAPDGGRLAIGQQDGTLSIVNLDDGSTSHLIAPESASFPTSLAFLPDGNVLMVGHEDGSIAAIDRQGRRLADHSFQINEVPRALEFCPLTRRLGIATDTGMIFLWDLDTKEIWKAFKAHTSRINVLRVLPNGRTLVSGGRDRELRLWDTTCAEQLTALSGHARQVFCVAISPNGQTLASGDLEGSVRFWRAPRDK